MIKLKQSSKFRKTNNFLQKALKTVNLSKFDKYGQMGVAALMLATPKETGKTALSWTYEIHMSKDTVSVSFWNTNIQNGVPIALVIQYGHAARDGSWVQGRDYINPAIRPIFDKMAADARKEIEDL